MKTLVAGISARAMALSAVRSGHPVVALDAFGDRDLKNETESYSMHRDFGMGYTPENLLTASRGLVFDAVAYTSNLENYPGILAGFGERHRIIGNSPQVVASVRNWPDLFDRLRQADFSVPETVFAGEHRPVGSERRWLLRPLLSGGGHGIRFVNQQTEHVSGGENRCCVPGFMLQEYIPGRPCSAALVADGGKCKVLGITEQLIGMRPFGAYGFRYTGNILPVPEMLDPSSGGAVLEKVRRLAEFLTREYGLTGLNGIDFILRNDQVYPTEVNPRYSASMEVIEIAYGLPVFDLHLKSVLNGELPGFDLAGELKSGCFYGKGYIYAEKDVTMPDTGKWLDRGICDVPESGGKIRKGSPICTIFAARPDREETLAELIRRAEKIKEEVYG